MYRFFDFGLFADEPGEDDWRQPTGDEIKANLENSFGRMLTDTRDAGAELLAETGQMLWDMFNPAGGIKSAGDKLEAGERLDGWDVAGVALDVAGVIPAAALAKGVKVGAQAVAKGSRAKDKLQTVYRVYGGDSGALGRSWTPVNPNSVGNYRSAAGLPSGGTSGFNNTGRFVIEGTVDSKNIMQIHPAQALDGHQGGLTEYIIDPAKVNISRVSGVNPQF